MTGLVFVDRLDLSVMQWGALLAAMLLVFRFPTWKGLGVAHALLVSAFCGVALSTDTRLLFQSAAYLQRFTWAQFLSEFAYRDYVKLQPPFYTFWVSRCPSLLTHQVGQTILAVFTGMLLLTVYGDRGKYLLATPVYLLVSTQPGNDFALFVALLCVIRLVQSRRPGQAAVVYGAAFLIKPLMLLTVPFLAWKMRGWLLVSVAIVAAYYVWSTRYYFGGVQWSFLQQQLALRNFWRLFAGGGGI